MKNRAVCSSIASAAFACSVVISGVCPLRAYSQQPGNPGVPGGQFAPQPGLPSPGMRPGSMPGGMPGGMPGMNHPGFDGRPLTALDIPLPLLQQALELNGEQTGKIAMMQQSARPMPSPGFPGQGNPGQGDPRFGPQPGPGQQGSGFPGGPGPQQAGPTPGGQQPGNPGVPGEPGFAPQPGNGRPEGQFPPRPGGPGMPPQQGSQFQPVGPLGLAPSEMMAVKMIASVLSPVQRKTLSVLLRQCEAFQICGLPMEASYPLRLTISQREKITSLGDAVKESDRKIIDETRATGEFETMSGLMQKTHHEMHEKLLLTLTELQRKTLEKFIRETQFHGQGFGAGQSAPQFAPSQGSGQ